MPNLDEPVKERVVFGFKKKSSPLKLELEKFDTLIGQNTLITGDLVLRESVRIDGTVRGDLKCEGDVPVSIVVGETGCIEGHVVAHRVLVAGRVMGNIEALERLELRSACHVQGDMRFPTIAVEHGATVLGALRKLEAEDQAATPRPQNAQPQIVSRPWATDPDKQ